LKVVLNKKELIKIKKTLSLPPLSSSDSFGELAVG
jgi:hypothetical protein